MPRKPRTISSTGIYHVIIRSVNKQQIFEEDADYLKFLYIFQDCKEKYDYDIYAYCIMSNHVHFLMQASPDQLSGLFKSATSQFVIWYNHKYQRCGHLFQGRFKSKPVEDERYFLKTILYIHENPVKANACRYITDYQWSSARCYYGTKNPLVSRDKALEIAGSHENLLKFFAENTSTEKTDCNCSNANDNCNEQLMTEFESIPSEYRLIDEVALVRFKELTGSRSPADIQRLPKVQRNDVIKKLLREHFTQKQVSRFCGVSLRTVARVAAQMQ